MISISSSSVPKPPGSATNASASDGHQGLALVHRADHPQVAQAAVRELAVDELLRDHAGRFAAGLEHGVGHDAHQPDRTAAEHEAVTRRHDLVAERRRLGGVGGVGAARGTAEDADPGHGGNATR